MSEPTHHLGLLVAQEEPVPNHSPVEWALIAIVFSVVARLVWATVAWLVAL